MSATNPKTNPVHQLAEEKNTKIVATLGPASSNYATMLELARSGVNVFRLNFSHGDHDFHRKNIETIRYINETYNMHIGILADLQGPKIRIGVMAPIDDPDGGVIVKEGDIITFTNEKIVGNGERIYMSYADFPKDVEAGEKVLLDDGKFTFEVVDTDGTSTVRLKVIYGGLLKSRKGVNLPDTKTSLPCLTPKDLVDLEFLLTQPINWIALSFVRRPEDIDDLRARLDAAGHPAQIVAKIEKPEAVENIDAIIKKTNAIMVARGDLGVEYPMEKVPLVQKQIVQKCIERARPVIVATQMMESMITNPSPTRAEVNDVANAVMDGADAVMLSGETAAGKFPVETVQAMTKIISEAEKFPPRFARPEANPKAGTFLSDVICLNAARIADQIEAKAIIGFTGSGYTAFRVSSYRPNCNIFIFSERRAMLNTLSLVWGVKGFFYDKYMSTDETILETADILKSEGMLKRGDLVVNTGSMPIGEKLRTNMLKISTIG